MYLNLILCSSIQEQKNTESQKNIENQTQNLMNNANSNKIQFLQENNPLNDENIKLCSSTQNENNTLEQQFNKQINIEEQQKTPNIMILKTVDYCEKLKLEQEMEEQLIQEQKNQKQEQLIQEQKIKEQQKQKEEEDTIKKNEDVLFQLFSMINKCQGTGNQKKSGSNVLKIQFPPTTGGNQIEKTNQMYQKLLKDISDPKKKELMWQNFQKKSFMQLEKLNPVLFIQIFESLVKPDVRSEAIDKLKNSKYLKYAESIFLMPMVTCSITIIPHGPNIIYEERLDLYQKNALTESLFKSLYKQVSEHNQLGSKDKVELMLSKFEQEMLDPKVYAAKLEEFFQNSNLFLQEILKDLYSKIEILLKSESNKKLLMQTLNKNPLLPYATEFGIYPEINYQAMFTFTFNEKDKKMINESVMIDISQSNLSNYQIKKI